MHLDKMKRVHKTSKDFLKSARMLSFGGFVQGTSKAPLQMSECLNEYLHTDKEAASASKINVLKC